MTRSIASLLIVLIAASLSNAQKVSSSLKSKRTNQNGNTAVVIDERLSVLREEPSLYASPVKRLETGTVVRILAEKTGDGVLFYRASDSTAVSGWIQSESIAGTFRKNDDQRLVRLILGSTGYTQIHRSAIFLDLFPDSTIRPTILLLFGDLVEEHAAAISERATENLIRREMAAARAPLHSFYLNYRDLDAYRMLGIRFLFNANTLILHYNGDSWFEITRKFPESAESIEARERIRALEAKMSAEN